ncbi:MAG TPA: hypothetical protein VHA37_01750 [Candidatus Saccharimonadales bacterium]|nr:hypothetical protein [Candidatus Saccharimonadales bacterium]
MFVREIDVIEARRLRAKNISYRLIGIILAKLDKRQRPYSAAGVMYAVEGRRPKRKPQPEQVVEPAD